MRFNEKQKRIKNENDMKKIVVMAVVAAFFSLSAMGQEDVGTFSLIPKIGVSIANVSGEEIYYENKEVPAKGKYNARFLGGVEAEYQILPTTSVSLGVCYVQQGCRFPDLEVGDISGDSEGLSRIRNKLDYIQCPLTVNQYLAEGLAIKAGVQLGFLVKSNFSTTFTPIKHVGNGVKEYGEPMDMDVDQKSVMNSMDISIPVGISYEYLNVVLDARYHFGLSKLYSEDSWPTEKNKFFTFTVGYKFNL